MKRNYMLFLLCATLGFAQTGSLCNDPIVISSLPFAVSDNTANFGDNYDPQTTTHPTCATTTFGNYYHGGNDVIYAYTPSVNQTLKIEIPNALGWTGMFVYTNCANIGVQYAACATGVSAGARTINNFSVTAGQTYYIYISSWPSPQTVTYTLNVTEVALSTNDLSSTLEQTLLYPNPTGNTLHIKSELPLEKVILYHSNGQQIGAFPLIDNAIDVTPLPTGLYWVELITTEQQKTVKRFVKS